jgi:hypothetical protein
MKIENLRSEQVGDRARVSATISWEKQPRPVFDMYYEASGVFAHDLTCNPHAFLIACIMPAFHYEEKRIRIDAPIAPELLEGLRTAMAWMRHWWYDPSKQLVRIEASVAKLTEKPRNNRRTGMFFSGGIDSLAALRSNRITFPADHPRFIQDGLIVQGLETEQEKSFQHVLATISEPAADAGLTLIPVRTNARLLEENWLFWERYSHDAILASIAYIFSNRFSEVAIASTYDIPSIQPAGTHPLLDLAYSSNQLMLRHDGISMSRIEKVQLVAQWDSAFDRIRTCNKSELYESEKLNCGRCIKCIRTMLELEALGLRDKCRAFPSHPITPELASPAVQIYRTTVDFYEALLEPLRVRGRKDLADMIQKKINTYQKQKEYHELTSALKTILKRYDRIYFGESLLKFKKMRRRGIS